MISVGFRVGVERLSVSVSGGPFQLPVKLLTPNWNPEPSTNLLIKDDISGNVGNLTFRLFQKVSKFQSFTSISLPARLLYIINLID